MSDDILLDRIADRYGRDFADFLASIQPQPRPGQSDTGGDSPGHPKTESGGA
jgi:hypothetical protein